MTRLGKIDRYRNAVLVLVPIHVGTTDRYTTVLVIQVIKTIAIKQNKVIKTVY